MAWITQEMSNNIIYRTEISRRLPWRMKNKRHSISFALQPFHSNEHWSHTNRHTQTHTQTLSRLRVVCHHHSAAHVELWVDHVTLKHWNQQNETKKWKKAQMPSADCIEQLSSCECIEKSMGPLLINRESKGVRYEKRQCRRTEWGSCWFDTYHGCANVSIYFFCFALEFPQSKNHNVFGSKQRTLEQCIKLYHFAASIVVNSKWCLFLYLCVIREVIRKCRVPLLRCSVNGRTLQFSLSLKFALLYLKKKL